MIQRRCRARFLDKTLQPVRIRRVRRGQNLDRYDAVEPRIPSPINLAHSSAAEEGLDVVGT